MVFKFKGNRYEYEKVEDFDAAELPEVHPCTSGKHKDKYLELSCAFDIETSTIDEDHATMYVWSFAIGKQTIIGRTWEQFVDLCRRISLHYDLNGIDVRLLCWVHNFSYEWSFCRKWFEFKEDNRGKVVFATSERNVIYACTTFNIEFRDSYILTARSLKKLPAAYGFADRIKKLTEDAEYDYKKIRNSETPLSIAEIAYSINDVQILALWHKYYIVPTFIRSEKKIPLTSTGIVRAELKSSFKKMPKEQREYWRRKIDRSFPDMDTYGIMITWLYRGGFVHSNRAHVGYTLINEDFGSVDFKSSYPAVMLHEKYPMRFVQKDTQWFYDNVHDGKRPCINHKLLKEFAYHGFFTFVNIRSKTSHALESISKLYYSENVYEDNGRVISADVLQVCLCDVDFLNYMDCYEWDNVTCDSLFIADKEYLPEYLRDIVLKYFWQKETYSKDDPERNLAKAKLNSCYGMCVTGLFNATWKLNEDNDLEVIDSDINWRKIISSQILLPQWGIWVSAYARRALIGTMMRIQDTEDVAYCDTDSMKMCNITNNMYVINAYNDRMRRINGTMYVGEYDRKIFKDLGIFDYEGKYLKAKFMGAKRYIHTDIHVSDGKSRLSHEVTVAGLPKHALIEYCKDNNADIYDVFNFGMQLTEMYADKLQAVYNDEGFTDMPVTDYMGHTVLQTERSCVSLVDTTFEMWAKRDYIILLEKILAERRLKFGRH